jgi:hypothetical protein
MDNLADYDEEIGRDGVTIRTKSGRPRTSAAEASVGYAEFRRAKFAQAGFGYRTSPPRDRATRGAVQR